MAQTIPAKTETAEIVSRDPTTGEEIGRAPLTMPEEVARAVGRARAAQPAWAARSFNDRCSSPIVPCADTSTLVSGR